MAHYFHTAENPAEGAAFTYHLATPGKVRLLVSNAAGKVIRDISGPGDAGVIHRVNWDLRYAVPPGTGRGGGGGGGEEGGGGGNVRAGVVQLPIPSHDIGSRGPHVAPGTFKVTLDVDGTAVESRTFEVRVDPTASATAADHKQRDAFVVEVMALLEKVDKLAADVRTRRAAATGEEATRLQALEQRLAGAGGRGGRGGGGRGAGAPAASTQEGAAPAAPPVQPVRPRLAALLNPYMMSGARTGTVVPPTGALRELLEEAKKDLAAIEKEIR
jgi:hypothetical protein